MGVSVWPSPRVDWQDEDRDARTLRRAATRLERAMIAPRAELSLSQVVQLYVGQTTPATDPDFFVADDAYRHDCEPLALRAAPWKKAVGAVAYRVVDRVLRTRLGPKRSLRR